MKTLKEFCESQGMGQGFPSFKDSFKCYPELVWIRTARGPSVETLECEAAKDRETLSRLGRRAAKDARYRRRLSTESVKADMIAIGKGRK